MAPTLFIFSPTIPKKRVEELEKLVQRKEDLGEVVALQTSVYVLDSFEATSVTNLSTKYPFMISLSLFENWVVHKCPFPVTSVNPAVFSSIFSGLVLSTSQLSSKQRKFVSTYASYMGGQVTHCYTSKVSHLITEVPNTQKFLLAKQRGDFIVTPTWLHDCWSSGKLLPVDKYIVHSPSPKTCKPQSEDLTILSPSPKPYQDTLEPSMKVPLPLTGCIISVSGYSSQQRQSIKQIVMQLGGSYSINLTSHVSHFLCENRKRKKFSEALTLSIPFCVTGSWLETCFHENKRVAEQKYFLIAPPLDPSLTGFAYLESIQIRFNQVAASPGSIFNGIHFRTEGFEAEEISDISEVLRSYGAASINSCNDSSCSYFLITPHGYHTSSGRACNKLFTITANWIERCIEEGKLLDPTEHLLFSPLSCMVPMEGTKGKSVCISGIHSKERRNFRMMLIVLGFKYEECLTRCVDYLITKPPISASSNKSCGAREWNIPQIHYEWILTSAKLGKLLPLSSYYMETPPAPLPTPQNIMTTHITIPSRSPSPVLQKRSPSPSPRRSPVIIASGEPAISITPPTITQIAKNEEERYQPSWDPIPGSTPIGIKRTLPLVEEFVGYSTPKRKKQKKTLFSSSAAKAFAEHNLEELPPSERKREALLSEFESFDEKTIAAIDLCLSPITPTPPTLPLIIPSIKEEKSFPNIPSPEDSNKRGTIPLEVEINEEQDIKESETQETTETQETEIISHPSSTQEEDNEKKKALMALDTLLAETPMEKGIADPGGRPSEKEESAGVQKMRLCDFECSQQSEEILWHENQQENGESSFDDQIVVCNDVELCERVITGSHIDMASFCAQFDTAVTSSFCIGFSSMDPALKKQLKEIVTSLGGSVVDSTSKLPYMTHLITQKPSRSLKYLSALAKGSWILRAEFLWSSDEKKGWVNEEAFVVHVPSFSPAHYWRNVISNGGESSKPFFGMKVALFTTNSYEADISQVLVLGGATVVYTLSHSGPIQSFFHTITVAIMDDSLTSTGDVLEHLKAFQRNGIPCISARYISDYLLHHPTTTRKEYELTLKKRKKPFLAGK